ncbi:MAG TPA: LysM peptidoglycan-binding domain-containing protein [Polyangiaceae bacterium]
MLRARVGVLVRAGGIALLGAASAQAAGFGPDTAAPTVPADSGGSVVITTSNNGTSTYTSANPGEGAKAPTGPIVVTGAQDTNAAAPNGAPTDSKTITGTNGILPEDNAHAAEAPMVHVVRRGDTLWDLCDHYYSNPWAWPKVWSYNPQILNPHWIYPGDQVRLRDPNAPLTQAVATGTIALGNGQDPNRLINRRPSVPKDTVFLRDQGFLGDEKRDVWGELIGATEEQMMLADGNHVFLIMRPGVDLQPGQQLTVFNAVRPPDKVPGARTPPGQIVSVRGTVKVKSFNPQTRVAEAEIIESLDVIERGAKVGPVTRRFTVTPPHKATGQIAARVLTSLYPYVYLAQDQVVFLDHGSEDGLVTGNRMFILRKGDSWRASLTTGSRMTRDRMRVDTPQWAEVETTPVIGDDSKFPAESVAELRVLSTEKYSAIALVTQSTREVVSGDLAVTRPGE